MKALALVLLAGLLVTCSAHAAKVEVEWVNPSSNTDGSRLTNLASVIIEWGSCAGSNIFGTRQASITVPTTVPGASLSAFTFPVGLSPACFHARAVTTTGLSSAWSAAVEWTAPATPGQPVTLGKPVILN